MNTRQTPADPLKFTCPRCNQTVTATDAQSGTRTQCPHCQQTIKVPGTPSSTTSSGREDHGQALSSPGAQTGELTLICTHCQTLLQAHLNQVGQSITCSECLESILVEAPSKPAPPLRPPVQITGDQQAPQSRASEATLGGADAPGDDQSETAADREGANLDTDDFDDYTLAEVDAQPWSTTSGSSTSQPASQSSSPEVDEENEYKLADPEVHPPPIPAKPTEADSRITSDGEGADEEIVVMEAVNKVPKLHPSDPIEPATPADSALTEVNPDEEFGILCRLCGTRIYVRMRNVGQEVKCPDCHSKTTITKPTKTRPKRPATAHLDSDHLDLEKLDPELDETRSKNHEKRKMAQKTMQEAREKKPTYFKEEGPSLELETPPIALIKFLVQPQTLGYWGFLAVGATFLASFFYFALNPPGQGGNAGIARVIWVCLWILTSLSGVLVVGFTSVTLLTIAGETANGTLTIENWPPATGFLDWALDTLYVTNSFFIAALPGAAITAPLVFLGAPMWVCLVPVVLSLAALVPILFASMFENRSSFNPVATMVWRSLKANTSCWTTFYVISPIILISAYAIGCGYGYGYILANFFISIAIVGLIFVYFRLLGWVIWKVREQSGTER